ncbi:8866_t:CDS:2, partial [Dentiscutata erythropus]
MKLWDSNRYDDQGTMDESSPFDDLFKFSRTQRLYAFGICTGFLVGFAKQIKTMFAPVRWLASTVFVASMALTLVVAFL